MHDLRLGDCREIMRGLADNSIDSVVTDPPYGLGFMGKEWDSPGSLVERKPDRSVKWDKVGGNHNPCNSADAVRTKLAEGRKFQVWCETWAAEALRVLKPGGHLLAFGGSRTYHRMVCAIEDAGFEVRDQIMWVYGSGFPKSRDVSKAMDAEAGAEREVVGRKTGRAATPIRDIRGGGLIDNRPQTYDASAITAPATDLARQWEGWGTALKPAHEPIVVARKPLQGTVAQNVATWGTGALNIDASRVLTNGGDDYGRSAANAKGTVNAHNGFDGKSFKIAERDGEYSSPLGRWPANLIHDGSDEVLDLFASFGERKSSSGTRPRGTKNAVYGKHRDTPFESYGDTGTAARFFYCAKASKADRGEGNTHPTVKPTALMRYLCRLVTPPHGTILDPFMGSGSTGRGALYEGLSFIGVETDPAYFALAERRMAHAEHRAGLQLSLFSLVAAE